MKDVLSHLASDPYRISSKNPPRLRGKFHLASILPAIALGIWLIANTDGSGNKVVVAVYAFTIVFMFSVSSVYHNFQWTDKQWWRMRKLDHTAIYMLIAGTSLAYAILVLRGEVRIVMLAITGGLFVVNVIYRWLPLVPFRGVMNSLFLSSGWLAVVFSKWLWEMLGVLGFSLLIAGGLVFTLGSVVLGARKPNPNPAVFGYHEIWHLATIVGVGLHAAGLTVGVL